MVALLALTMAFALISCGQTQESTTTTTETTPPAETGTEGGMMSDTSMADTAMSHME